MTTLRKALVVIVALVVVLFIIGLVGTIRGGHTAAGCNHIPLVNGQPVHPCAGGTAPGHRPSPPSAQPDVVVQAGSARVAFHFPGGITTLECDTQTLVWSSPPSGRGLGTDLWACASRLRGRYGSPCRGRWRWPGVGWRIITFLSPTCGSTGLTANERSGYANAHDGERRRAGE